AVVAAEFQDKHVDTIFQQPVQSGQSAGAGVAALTGVDHLEIPTFGVDLRLNQRRKGLRLLQTVTGGDAVAEKQDYFRRCRRGTDETNQQAEAKPRPED